MSRPYFLFALLSVLVSCTNVSPGPVGQPPSQEDAKEDVATLDALKTAKNTLPANRQGLIPRPTNDGVVPSKDFKQIESDTMLPGASHKTEPATRKDLKLFEDKSEEAIFKRQNLSHVLLQLAEPSNAFAMRAANPEFNLNVVNAWAARPKYPDTKGALSVEFIERLERQGRAKLPLLGFSGGAIFRPSKVCIADRQSGVCEKDLSAFLKDKLSDHFAGDPLKTEPNSPVRLPLFAVLNFDGSMKVGPDKAVVIVFEFVNLVGATGNLGEGQPAIHPGDNYYLAEAINYALQHYIRKFSGVEADASMWDFIHKFHLADCDMVAQAVAYRARKEGLREKVWIGIGNRPENPGELDIVTSNHAWNVVGDSLRHVAFEDLTPASSDKLELVFNDKTLEWTKRKVDAMHSFATFGAGTRGQVPRGYRLSDPTQWQSELFDVADPSTLLPKSDSEIRERISAAELRATESVAAKLPAPNSYTEIRLVKGRSIVNLGPLGESLFFPTQVYGGNSFTWDLYSDWSGDFKKTIFAGMNWTGQSRLAEFESTVFDVEEEKPFYDFPRLEGSEVVRHASAYAATFKLTDPAKFLNVLRSGDFDSVHTIDGKITIRAYKHGFMHSTNLVGDPSPAELAKFWRKQGVTVKKVFPLKLNFFTYSPR